MTAFYNEFDPYAAQWLRNLIKAGHIAPGEVDERSIEDILPSDLAGFTQCHFFAGIGVWSLALRRAGWDDTRPVWTGSCPCQPFSAAGKGVGFADERHLWPAFNHLIAECKPAIILGEQVASGPVGDWIDLVHADMEGLGYAFGGIPFPSAGVGAPHIRDRLYWMAHAISDGRQQGGLRNGRDREADSRRPRLGVSNASEAYRLADHNSNGRSEGAGRELHDAEHHAEPCGGADGMGIAESDGRKWPGKFSESTGWNGTAHDGAIVGLADDLMQQRPNRQPGIGNVDATPGRQQGTAALAGFRCDLRPRPTNGIWGASDWLGCRDGKWRPVEPGTFPLAPGAAGGVGRMRADQERIAALPRKDQGSRIGRLKGYGNAINAEAARVWIETVMECST